MTGPDDPRCRLTEAREHLSGGRLAEARDALGRLLHHPDRHLLGPPTVIGLPRKLHAAFLRLAKREGDALARAGYQATLVPPTDRLAELLRLPPAAREAALRLARSEVPRTIHQVWIGGRPEPVTCRAWTLHADRHGYAYRLWREDDLARLGVPDHPVYRERMLRGDWPGAVDVARYAILAAEGGIYLDCDWYPARADLSFHNLLPLVGFSAFAEDIPRTTAAGAFLLANSFLAAPPGHPVFAHLLARLDDVRAALPDAPAWWATGPLVLTLAARDLPLILAGAGFVAGALPPSATVSEAEARATANEAAGGGLLLAWKPWGAV